jgi:hypothetical protein
MVHWIMVQSYCIFGQLRYLQQRVLVRTHKQVIVSCAIISKCGGVENIDASKATYLFQSRRTIATTDIGIARINRSVEMLSVSCKMLYLCQVRHSTNHLLASAIVKYFLIFAQHVEVSSCYINSDRTLLTDFWLEDQVLREWFTPSTIECGYYYYICQEDICANSQDGGIPSNTISVYGISLTAFGVVMHLCVYKLT